MVWEDIFLCVDNTHSLGNRSQFNAINFTSPRKFLPLTDGGVLYNSSVFTDDVYKSIPIDKSLGRISWLFRALEEGSRCRSYDQYKIYRASIQNLPLSKMSVITQNILKAISISRTVESD